MKIGTLYAYWQKEWGGDLALYSKLAKKVKSLGGDVLEVGAGDLLTMSHSDLVELKAVAKDLDLELTSNIGPAKEYDTASSDPATRDRGVQFLCDIMDAMDVLDSRRLIGVMYTCWPYHYEDLDKPAVWARGVESSKRLGAHAQDLGITLSMEVVNRFETMVLNTAAEAVQFCREVDSPAVKILLDTFHMNIEEDDLPDAIRTAGPLLGHLHAGESNRRPPRPGPGSLDWEGMGKALREIGFDGCVVMEPFVIPGGSVARDIKLWRDLRDDASEAAMDRALADSIAFLRRTLA